MNYFLKNDTLQNAQIPISIKDRGNIITVNILRILSDSPSIIIQMIHVDKQIKSPQISLRPFHVK